MQFEAPALAPELQVSEWFNTPGPLSLAALRGRVVLLHAFQMLCPGCVSHGLPQAAQVGKLFPRGDVSVIGLHTVFEHHDVMTSAALRAFIHEYRLPFPVGIDQAAADGDIPLTMRAYALRGTPSLVLIDRQGRVRLNHFGQIDDLALGALIGQLMAEGEAPLEAAAAAGARASAATPPDACDDLACRPS